MSKKIIPNRIGRKSFAELITHLRIDILNMERPKFAEILDKPYRTIQDWELGRSIPRTHTRKQIEAKFGIDLAYWKTGDSKYVKGLSAYNSEFMDYIRDLVETFLEKNKYDLLYKKRKQMFEMLYHDFYEAWQRDKTIDKTKLEAKVIHLIDFKMND